ncbi:Uncharacterized protein OBRU01_21604 [Operophtera brumata]|uniref:Uncharacterized protein n=1 Tax=Operophtera brumata TaxID=104452 RepID=A0A0L7KSH2_OPEBR|nr:Uncharacterized protein OBRU01_21604 [Operophtera brumata]
MSVSAEADVSSPLSDGQSTLGPTLSKSSSDSQSLKTEDIVVGQDVSSEPSTPKATPMAFVIDFGEAKAVDNRRLEELAKKSQARHQRVQSMSASSTRTIPAIQRPPMSAKLPRKAQGYNSEGYFSSDQEDSGLSNSLKAHRAQKVPSPVTNRNIKSPLSDSCQPNRTSKSPIVDSIMSRSDNFTLNPRHGLNLPLKSNSYVKDVQYHTKIIADIVDQSPVLLADISSPELDILTPDNILSIPEVKSPMRKSRASSETPDLFKRCIVNEPLYIDDDVDRQSNSSTGTYTIEGDNYTEEQKARMSIDRNFAAAALHDSFKRETSADPELIFDLPNRVITKEPRRDTALRSPNATSQTFGIPKVSKDKNVLEISCCYESPTENDLAAQTSKQIKSTRSYLEKIKNRVRTITEKTFPKSPKNEDDDDVGSFTSVTTSGVLSSKYPYVQSVTTSGVLSKHQPKVEVPTRRRCSLTKSEIDQTDFIHRLSRESSVPVSDYRSRESSVPMSDYLHRLSRETSVPVSLPSSKSAFDDPKFESTVLRTAQKALRDDNGLCSDLTPDQVVGKLSNLSLNRCKGDKTWIQDWADSVKNVEPARWYSIEDPEPCQHDASQNPGYAKEFANLHDVCANERSRIEVDLLFPMLGVLGLNKHNPKGSIFN